MKSTIATISMTSISIGLGQHNMGVFSGQAGREVPCEFRGESIKGTMLLGPASLSSP
jgi:hypothetical protein